MGVIWLGTSARNELSALERRTNKRRAHSFRNGYGRRKNCLAVLRLCRKSHFSLYNNIKTLRGKKEEKWREIRNRNATIRARRDPYRNRMYIRFRSTDRFGHVTVKKRTQASNEKKKKTTVLIGSMLPKMTFPSIYCKGLALFFFFYGIRE